MGAGVMRDCLPHSLPHNFACTVPKSTSSEGKVPSSTLETEELAAVAHRSTLGECKLQTIATTSWQDGGSRDQQNAIESRLSSELMEARETYEAAKCQFKTRAGQAGWPLSGGSDSAPRARRDLHPQPSGIDSELRRAVPTGREDLDGVR